MQRKEEKSVAVVGLGYVGLPLALAFGRVMKTIGYDCCADKIRQYQTQNDPTGEFPPSAFEHSCHLTFASSPELLREADFIIIAVPTPINSANQPDLTCLKKASKSIAPYLKTQCIVIYESTVYPGVTEEVCAPLLEAASGKKRGEEFYVGYSPERINPGDQTHTLEKIVKVVAGENGDVLDQIAQLYGQIIEAGVHRASSIQVAEAAKVIENTQRDLNIALINELALIFQKLNIDTEEVLRAAGTKWNFLPFRPGLVGGHCIGVDPYYLTYKAQQVGYHAEVILSGRRINDNMGHFIAQETVKQMIQAGLFVKHSVVLIMGLTFKENCKDLRNSRVIDIIEELYSYDVEVAVWDPIVEEKEAEREYNLPLVDWQLLSEITAVIAAVPHKEVLAIDLAALAQCSVKHAPFIDVKSAFDKTQLESLNFSVWRL